MIVAPALCSYLPQACGGELAPSVCTPKRREMEMELDGPEIGKMLSATFNSSGELVGLHACLGPHHAALRWNARCGSGPDKLSQLDAMKRQGDVDTGDGG